MLIFLCGPDDYRRLQRKNFYLAATLKKYPSARLEAFDFSGENPPTFSLLREFIHSTSLFGGAKVAIVEEALAVDKAEALAVFRAAAAWRETHVLVVERRAPTGRDSAFLFDRPVTYETFEYLKGAPWREFVTAWAARLSVRLSPAAIAALSAAYQNDTWALITEIEKMSLGGPFPEHIAAGGGPQDIWAQLGGLRSATWRVRLGVLEKTFSSREAPAKLFNMWAALDIKNTPRFAEYDLKIKSGKLDYAEALLDAVLAA